MMHLPQTFPSVDSSVSPYLLAKAFPFHLAFTRSMQIVQMGDEMQRFYPSISPGSLIQQHFQIKRPNISFDFDTVCQKPNALILLECTYDGSWFRGQVVYFEQQEAVFLLISPWLSSPDSLKSLELKLSDASLRASISDFLFLLQARSATLTETKRLAERLTEQRAGLHQALRQAELATAVLEQAADAIEITDAETKILYVNSAFEKATGYRRDEVLGKKSASLFLAEQREDTFLEKVWQTVSAGQVWQGSYFGQHKDGSLYYQEMTLFPIYSPTGKITNYVAIKRDISDRKQTQIKLEHSLALLQATFEATADGILVTDIQGRILNYNHKFVDLWRIPKAVLMSRDYQQVMQFIARCLKNPNRLSAPKVFELCLRPHLESHDTLELEDGRVLEQYSCPQKVEDTVIGWVWSFRDITEQQRTAAKIRYQALHDSLTGLPNRTLFSDRLSQALSRAARSQTELAVMFLDLDRFKLINDTLGHAAGDQLLKQVAFRIKTCLRQSDTFARWAGDEFTLLLPSIQGVEDAIFVAQKILDALKPDYDLEGYTLHATSSIGIAIYPTDGEDAETLLKHADAALYRAKDAGRNGYQLYTPTLNIEASDWLALESHLHRALERQEFVLYYQPQINVVTGGITQMEALLRWQHPEMGLVPPGRFIPLAEDNGLIVPIGEWVLRTACTQNQIWQSMGLPPVRMAVNLSFRQLRQPKLPEKIQRILQETGLDPRYLELEITETTAMNNVELTKTILSELHQMGISTAMDDFGTGYSSLSYLKKLPFHTLKIDQSFVRDLTTDPNDKAIVAAIIAMGRVLKLRLVAEGVETTVQKHSLLSLDCEEMQGHLFSAPIPAEGATKLLRCHTVNSQALRA